MSPPPADGGDPRQELARLVAEVRHTVAREIERGHRLTSDPELRAFALRKGGAVGAAATQSAGAAAGAPAAATSRPAAAPATAPAAAPGAAAAPPAASRMARSAAPPEGPPPERVSAPPAPAPRESAAPRESTSAAPAAGFAHEPAPEPAVPAHAGSAAAPKPAAKALSAVGYPAADARPLEEMTAQLARLSAEAGECRKCGLCETRTRVVYGTGTARQPLMFVGEAPGFNEDQEGLPFVGRAGKLLTDIITAMGFERSQVYIANVLKCRPPENRDPLPHEVEACTPWLEQQIELVRPRVICTVGRHSAQLLTGRPKDTIGTLRGKVHYYKGIPVVPTYHPAFLLRSPGYKRFTWEDVQLVRDLYLKSDAPLQSEVGGHASGDSE